MTGLITSRFLAFWGLWLCLATPVSWASDTTWIPYQATYVASLNNTVVDEEGRRELRYLGNGRFRFSAIAENMLFKIEEISEFHVTNQVIRPIQYQSTRSNPFKKKTKAAGFDWDNKLIHYQDHKRSGTKPLSEGMFDPLSSVFELAKQVREKKKEIFLTEVTGRKIKKRHLIVVGEETLNLPIGSIKTIKMQKVGDKRQTTIWLAPEFNYLAAKVTQNDDGEIYDIELKKYQPRNPVELPTPINAEPPTEETPIISEPPLSEEDIK